MSEAKKSTKLSRRDILKAGLYGTLATGLSSAVWINGCRKKLPTMRPNILFISIDTLRADHLSCYGYTKPTSPHIDLLASGAHLFKRAYTTIPTTLPSHLSMFTSMYPTQLAVTRNGHYVGHDRTTLPEILKEHGYSTAAFVNYFVLGRRYGFTQGFDTVVTREGHADQPLPFALRWLREYKSEKPFFMFAHFFDPHTMYDPIAHFKKKFAVTDRRHPVGRGFVKKKGILTPKAIQEDINAYDAEIASADWAVGHLIAELKRSGLEDDTMIFLVSDHGESLDDLAELDYFFDHSEFLYNHQINIPLIIRLPKAAGAEGATVHDVPVSTIDLMPTILELLGIEKPSFNEGHSLLGGLLGSHITQRPVFGQAEAPNYDSPHRFSIIVDKWHMIMSKEKVAKYELFDVIKDPAEKNDLYKIYPEIAQKLRNDLSEWTDQLKRKFSRSTFETDQKQLEKLRSLGYIK